MVDYLEALRRGLDAQRKLDQAKQELALVLETVSADLQCMLGPSVQFMLGAGIRTIEGLQTQMQEIMGFVPTKTKKHIWEIQVKKTMSGNSRWLKSSLGKRGIRSIFDGLTTPFPSTSRMISAVLSLNCFRPDTLAKS